MADHKIKYVLNPLKGMNWLEGQPYAKSSSEEGARERGDRVSAQRRRGGRETLPSVLPFLGLFGCAVGVGLQRLRTHALLIC